MLNAKDVQKNLQVSQAKAYEIIRSLNVELKEKGFYVLQGKINKDYFEERFYGKDQLKMPAYRDKERNTWYSSFKYKDWSGKSKSKTKRGFATKKEAQNWESRTCK